jgi:eukaryotic-like serine/threonine-protein kinase
MRIEIEQEIPTYAPSSQASFKRWLADYRYEKTPLDAKITETKDTADWQRETITFNGANGVRAMAYLYLPKHFARPLQVIHLVPTSEVESGLRSITIQMENHLGPCLKAGRALFGVVLEGYLERLRPEGFVEPSPTTVEYLDQVVRAITDLRRGLDYLETRSELDVGRIGLFAPSAGSRTGLLVTAIETRYRSVMFSGAGLRKSFRSVVAGANPIGFAPHVRGPILMMHGKYDESAALKTEAEPLFKLLPQPKRLLLYEGGHVAPFEFFVTSINKWMDETLGPVKHNSP